MAENVDLPNNTYIEVPKRLIKGAFFTSVPISDKDKPLEVKLARIALEDKKYAEEHSLEPPDRLKNAFELAREKINALRQKIGLAPATSMSVLYLDEQTFSRLFPDDFAAGNVPVSNLTAIKHNENLPDYLLGSLAFHELVHQQFDKHVITYYSEAIADDTDYSEDIYKQTNRSGLQVRKVPNDSDTQQPIQGELFNELGNYALQAEYIREALRNQQIFGDELTQRMEHMTQFHQDPSLINNVLVDIPMEDKTYQVRLDADKFHYDKKGQLLISNDSVYLKAFLLMQFADDLKRVCGDIDGESLFELYLRAKEDPKKQNKMREIIDNKLGVGFYSRLKNLSKDDNKAIFGLISEVQNKSKGLKAEENA